MGRKAGMGLDMALTERKWMSRTVVIDAWYTGEEFTEFRAVGIAWGIRSLRSSEKPENAI